jgi:regulator of sirC expression with transglutaminase-like and TPR domain
VDTGTAEAILREAGQAADGDIDLARTALAFAACARPEAGEARFDDHLRQLIDDVAREAAGRPASLEAQAASLRAVLVERHGYRGDRESYDDLSNADLSQVIERKRGLPVALSILWLHAGRGQGWSIDGLNFPGHFILRLEAAGERLILDPFNDGQALDTNNLRALLKSFAGDKAELDTAHYQPLPNRAILLRLQNNIKIRLLNANAYDRALPVIERMLLVAPRDAALWREAGLVHRQLENLRAAITCLETASGLAEALAARQRIAAEITALKSRLN